MSSAVRGGGDGGSAESFYHEPHDPPGLSATLSAVFDACINFFDTANMYSPASEEIFGRALNDFAGRDELAPPALCEAVH